MTKLYIDKRKVEVLRLRPAEIGHKQIGLIAPEVDEEVVTFALDFGIYRQRLLFIFDQTDRIPSDI